MTTQGRGYTSEQCMCRVGLAREAENRTFSSLLMLPVKPHTASTPTMEMRRDCGRVDNNSGMITRAQSPFHALGDHRHHQVGPLSKPNWLPAGSFKHVCHVKAKQHVPQL